MTNPDISTPEWRRQNRGNIEWLGNERTVRKAIKVAHPTRASYLHAQRVITGQEKDIAERIMDLYIAAGRNLHGYQLFLAAGSTIPILQELTKRDELFALARYLGSYWACMHHHFLAELLDGAEGYRRSIPHKVEIDNIRSALDRADTFFYEWAKNYSQHLVDSPTKKC